MGKFYRAVFFSRRRVFRFLTGCAIIAEGEERLLCIEPCIFVEIGPPWGGAVHVGINHMKGSD